MARETVRESLEDGVLEITLDRPESRNALDAQLSAELLDAVRDARDNDDARSVLLTGAGRGFCAGADMAMFGAIDDPDEVREFILDHYKPLIVTITEMDKPVLAAVNGSAAGVGASIALACDLRVMADDAEIYQAFIKIGLIPDGGSSWLLARQIGYSRALEVAVSGEPIPAKRCRELGLANRVVAPDDLLEQTRQWAQKLAQMPTVAIGLTKEAMHHAMEHDLASTIEKEADLQARAARTEDHAEGVAAFLQKREPDFKGD